MYEVMIVEDDPMVAMINKQYVTENKHFHVSCVCRDGDRALAMLRESTVHLVILDVYMPKINGLELLRKIREINIPVSVIMVTAANDSAAIEEAMRLGVVDYLVKPFSSARFQRALETFLNRQDAFHDLSSFSQQHIDAIMNRSSSATSEQLSKGIQDQTLETVKSFLEQSPDTDFTSEEIADKVGLSRVTVRRYVNYLLEKGVIVGNMNYETGGRPCMLYRLNKSE